MPSPVTSRSTGRLRRARGRFPKTTGALMAKMTVNGAELSFRDEGSGHPLLLLHGWSMSGRFFERQMQPFAAQYRVVVPDFRGHGESEKVLRGHTVEQYAADVHALAEA